MKDKIPNIMISRAVELWCRKLFAPKFDNGDDSEAGFIGGMLATINLHKTKDAETNLSDKVEVFRTSLTKALIELRGSEEYFYPWLNVDYYPCELLSNAAKEAEIPERLFSCKSSVKISDDYVTESFGYGAETFFHYQLSDGKWLITSLSGSDIDKIKNQIMNGNDLGLTVE